MVRSFVLVAAMGVLVTLSLASAFTHNCAHDVVMKDVKLGTIDVALDVTAGYQPLRVVSIYSTLPADIKNTLVEQRIQSFTDTAAKKLGVSVSAVYPAGPLKFFMAGGQCDSISVPADHISTGVSNADLVVYVTYMQTTVCDGADNKSSSDDAAAYAVPCLLETGSNKPRFARLNYCPSQFKEETTGSTVLADKWRGVALHELLHALGFGNDFFSGKFAKKIAFPVTGSAPERNYSEMRGSNVIEKTKEHFSCDTATGFPLETAGGAATVNSHWSKRFVMNEVMNAESTYAPLLSAMTLAALGDLQDITTGATW